MTKVEIVMSSEPRWMPVFVAVEAIPQPQFAAHPSHQGTTRVRESEPDVRSEEFTQRIGTAFALEDGSFVIQLTAFPVNGRLLMRPPLPGEYIDPRLRQRGT